MDSLCCVTLVESLCFVTLVDSLYCVTLVDSLCFVTLVDSLCCVTLVTSLCCVTPVDSLCFITLVDSLCCVTRVKKVHFFQKWGCNLNVIRGGGDNLAYYEVTGVAATGMSFHVYVACHSDIIMWTADWKPNDLSDGCSD